MKITSLDHETHPALPGLPRGVYPYLGGSVTAAKLREVVSEYGYAAVPGLTGIRLARMITSVVVDPAKYKPERATPNDAAPVVEQLFGYDEWVARQQHAGVPVILTDSPRIRARDRAALRSALSRWKGAEQATLVVLPLDPWWLKNGLSCLAGEVRAACRPVAIVLMDAYNGLDSASTVSGLITLISLVGDIPVVMLRCDVSAVGAVAYGAFAGFVGESASTRHGPVPMPAPKRGEEADEDDRPDQAPAVFVPSLHDYVKASRLPVISRREDDGILRCGDAVCNGRSLLRITRLAETDLVAARSEAYQHNMASLEHVARNVLGASEPRDAWWEYCKSGAEVAASLIGRGVSLPTSRWLRQWLELGSPSHEPVSVP
jgi:hypothetical protein